jgi:RNA polymerase sigma-70 factor (ECF subfamily)
LAVLASEAQFVEDLVRRIRAGDDEAFERLIEFCGPRVYALVYRMIGHHEDALDLVQDTFLRVYQALPRFRGECAFETWLYRIVVNVCHNELKRRRRRPLTFTESDSELANGTFSVLEQLVSGETPEDLSLRHECQRQLEQMIQQLPELYRLVVVLHDIQGLSYEELAAALNMNIGTVKSRLHRAHQLLREKIFQNQELFGLQKSQS